MFAAPFPKKKSMFSTPQPLKLVKPEWSSSGKLKSKSLYSSPMKTPSTPCKRKDSGPLIHFMLLNKENLDSLIHSIPLKNEEYVDYFSNFSLLSVLGQGTFGKVFQAVENRTGKEYAIKKIQAPFSGISAIERFQELQILWHLER